MPHWHTTTMYRLHMLNASITGTKKNNLKLHIVMYHITVTFRLAHVIHTDDEKGDIMMLHLNTYKLHTNYMMITYGLHT
jgi:hypothetical protein